VFWLNRFGGFLIERENERERGPSSTNTVRKRAQRDHSIMLMPQCCYCFYLTLFVTCQDLARKPANWGYQQQQKGTREREERIRGPRGGESASQAQEMEQDIRILELHIKV